MENVPRRNDPLISVIIPTYNVADCVGMCLDSLLKQTFDGFNIVCVDDASSDETCEVLERYAHCDNRIRVLRLNKNCGPSFARNYGIQKTDSELITFVDSDDIVSPYYLQTLFESWNTAGTRNAMVKARNVRGPREEVCNVEWQPSANASIRTITSSEAIREFLLERITVVTWACLAPRELYLEHPFPIGTVFEDHYLMIEHLESVESVVVVETPIYGYVRRPASLSNPKKHDVSYVTDMLTVVGHLLELSQHWGRELQGPLAWACAWRLALAISYCSDVTDKDEVRDSYSLATRYIRAHLPAIVRTWRSENLDNNQMLKILVSAVSPQLYWKTRKLVRTATGADKQ